MARFDRGWVKVPRDAVFGEIGKNQNRLNLYLVLFAAANFKESKIVWEGKARQVPRGALVTSCKELAKLTSMDRKTVTKHLNLLTSMDAIVAQKSHKGMLITINNYDGSEDLAKKDGHKGPTNMDTAMDTAMDTEVPHKKKERTQEGKNYTSLFEKVWARWPLHIGKPSALRRFDEQITTDEKAKDFAKAARNYLSYLDEQKSRGFDQQPRQLQYFLGAKGTKDKPWEGYIDIGPSEAQQSDTASTSSLGDDHDKVSF